MTGRGQAAARVRGESRGRVHQEGGGWPLSGHGHAGASGPGPDVLPLVKCPSALAEGRLGPSTTGQGAAGAEFGDSARVSRWPPRARSGAECPPVRRVSFIARTHSFFCSRGVSVTHAPPGPHSAPGAADTRTRPDRLVKTPWKQSRPPQTAAPSPRPSLCLPVPGAARQPLVTTVLTPSARLRIHHVSHRARETMESVHPNERPAVHHSEDGLTEARDPTRGQPTGRDESNGLSVVRSWPQPR